ncbi:aspartyl protease family protein [Pedobacter punctiformis]|uniref:Aspartyl protease family protein n=1 Tax=Pedobacter punctiformis TaxID=3004097 RepID=A0ABT4LAW5_9SPHI|nr:aspartyl protease family protein [Pedobacter sp. HCMS5-2]MCZ4245045.1 aspartyl protease family protein [Pedobacter sp. HCMS5-2]
MIIEIKLNGKLVPMIFDTGGKNAITSALKTEFGVAVTSSNEILDANSNKKHVDIVKLNQVETPDGKANYKDVPFIVVDNELFTCLGVGGLIASDLWQNNTIEIDDQRKEIKIRPGGMASLKDNKQAIPFVADANGAPIFSLKVGKFDQARVLFDSGAPEFLSINSKDYPRLEQQGALYMVRQGKGGGSLGVVGRSEIIGNRFLLQVPELIVGETSFTKFRVSVGNSPESLMGYKALHYGKITIDYINKLFLFVANMPGKIEIEADLNKNWDLEVREQDNQLIVGTVWEQLEGEVEVGDVVTHVDGKEIKSITFCESITTGIPALKEKGQVVLTVKTKQGTKNIKIDKN